VDVSDTVKTSKLISGRRKRHYWTSKSVVFSSTLCACELTHSFQAEKLAGLNSDEMPDEMSEGEEEEGEDEEEGEEEEEGGEIEDDNTAMDPTMYFPDQSGRYSHPQLQVDDPDPAMVGHGRSVLLSAMIESDAEDDSYSESSSGDDDDDDDDDDEGDISTDDEVMDVGDN